MATGKIAARVEGSRQSGGLAGFNAEFRKRRLAAQRAGQHFPTYGLALSRLRKVIAAHAPGAAGAVSHTLFEMVFGRND